MEKIFNELKNIFTKSHFLFFGIFLLGLFTMFFLAPQIFSSNVAYKTGEGGVTESIKKILTPEPKVPKFDPVAYDKKINELANNPTPSQPTTKVVKDPKTGLETTVTIPAKPAPVNIWPVKTVYPNAGAILPDNRIIAYYGNLYSTKMGALGQHPEPEMLARLEAEVKKWEAADPATPVVPALHYIAVVAQGSAGKDGKYRARMPAAEIDKVIAMAAKIDAIVFLDFQVAFSTLQNELSVYEKYFQMPNVHLGIDAEFSMKGTIPPGKVVGTFDAADINYAINYLSKIVKDNNLPPKVLVVHRYTQKMITNYKQVVPTPEVQIVMHMDGWGGKAKKIGTYKNFIFREPIQFTGFKLFYKNDVFDSGTTLFTPPELLKLSPIPSYIQYQ